MSQVVDAERESLVRLAAGHGPESWAEDAIHDAWIKVRCGEIRSIPPLVTDEQLLEWFLRIVRNEARNRRRTERIRCCELFDEVRDISVLHPGDSDLLLEDIVAVAVAKLPSAQREVAELRLSGWRLVDIATETRRTVGTVKRLWYRARRVLRTALGPYLGR